MLSDSSANWDILPEKKPKEAEVEKEVKPLAFSLDKLQITEGYLLYDNQLVDESMILENLHVNGNAKYKGEAAKIKTDIQADHIFVEATSGDISITDLSLDVDGLYDTGDIHAR